MYIENTTYNDVETDNQMGMDAVLVQIQRQATARALRITDHAREEMEEESIALAEVLEAIAVGQIIENYPEHRRGSCCLPTPPKWMNPIERNSR